MDEIHRPRRLERSEFNLTHLTLFLCIVSTAVGCDPASPNDREAGAHAPAATGDQRAESASAEPLAGKTEFDVVLIEVGNDKIGVIKVVRSATGLGLKDAKDLVEAAPKPIMTGMPKADGERLKSELEAVGAIVELR
ncbi:MAG: 50S ribosomal protein L7/L12 [Planctomycetaceae bacterium]